MNTIFIILIIASFLILSVKYIKAKEDYRDLKNLYTENSENQAKTIVKLKHINNQIKNNVIETLTTIITNSNKPINNTFPFKILTKEEDLVIPLSSIRFKKLQTITQIFVNGGMIPINNTDIILENITTLQKEDLNNIELLINNIEYLTIPKIK